MKQILSTLILSVIVSHNVFGQSEILRTPDERFANLVDYNFQPNYIEVEEGLRMHYLDEGDKDKPILLLLHGEPSWSYLYRDMIPLLKDNGFRVIAPDLIGFGKSDKFSDKNQYTYERSVKWIETFIEKLGLKEIVLFGQDWGGLIGLRVAAESSNRFAMIIASNTALPTGDPKWPEEFMNWLNFSQSSPDFKTGALINLATLKKLSEEEMAAYDAPFPSEKYKAAARIYPALVPLTTVDPQAVANQKAWKKLRKWKKPFLTIFGDSDPITGWSQDLFKSQIPGAKEQDHKVLNAGHFIQEDKSKELAGLITGFYKKNTAILVSSGLQNSNRELEKITTTNTQKEASDFTKKTNDAIFNSLPFEDNSDFEKARKGFIATIESGEILDDGGKLVYSMKAFDFIKGKAPSTTNPSLWRQSELNNINGLFEVTDGVYQIRGFDLANMSIIRGQKGWIIIDPLYSAETAKAGLDLANVKLGKRPVTAVIVTHSHIDHFGGIRGVVEEADVISGKVPIYVPEGFFDKSINENVMGGNTMQRRATYMFGGLLPKEPKGNIGSGLGQYLSSGEIGVLDGTDIINELSGEKRIIDGLNVEFIYTPEAEAPTEMMVYFNDYKSLCQAEIINHTLHNLYTLRGAKVRNGQKWSHYIDLAIEKWGDEVTSSFGSHHWPTWGNQSIKDYWKGQRDLYRFIHDQTLRLANKGYTPIEIAEMLKLPESLDKEFSSRGYYGTASHNSRAQYQLYFGWFDGNPANLNRLTPEESGKKYVEFMGGPEALLFKAQESYNQGDYRWVAEVVNHLVFADSKNQDARNLLADTYEQLGYVAESGPWRNFYLSGAKELRNRLKFPPTVNLGRPDFIKGMSLEQFFNFMAMKFIGTDHDASKMNYNFNFVFPDAKEKAVLLVSNGVVTPRIGSNLKEDATATISIKRSDLDRISLGEAKYPELVENGTVQIDGDINAFYKFLGKLDSFNLWFNIIEP